ncbi:MAG: CoA transferase [Gammaproteobacteria bacterium]|nr:CoA transferase [Gammaproteobacteria bacterium]
MGSTSAAGMTGVYDGIRVLDFSMFLAGPYCSRLMADMGADVIKIEPPGGDFLRAAPPLRAGHSAYFGHLNCGKRSVCIDLKKAGALDVLLRLAKDVDVVLENFRPGVMARLGLGYEAMRAVRPDVVYCSVSGYGQTGPSAHRPSFAPIVHAASGFDMLAPRYESTLDRPIQNRNAMADYLAATHALAGIGAALYHRATTGRGQHLDVALMDTMHHAMSYEYVGAQFPDAQDPPVFRPMRTLDGFVMIAPVSEANFKALAGAAEHPQWLEDSRFATRAARVEHWVDMLDTIESWTASKTSAEAEASLLAAGCPASVYRTIGEAQRDPHVASRAAAATVTDAAGAFQVANTPIKFADAPANARPRVARLGEDSHEVLSECGFGDDDIEQLRESGILVPTTA